MMESPTNLERLMVKSSTKPSIRIKSSFDALKVLKGSMAMVISIGLKCSLLSYLEFSNTQHSRLRVIIWINTWVNA